MATLVSSEPATGGTTLSRDRGRSGYFPTLDGWRALAVLYVMAYHGRDALFPAGSWIYAIAERGYLGVDIFFAISGFLICSRLLNELNGRGEINLRAFYIKRFFRIVPPFLAVLAATCFLGAHNYVPFQGWETIGSLFFIRNYLPVTGPNHGVYTSHFWSLSVEEHFYLFWPVMLAFLRPEKAKRFAVFSIIAISIWRILDAHFGILAPHIPLSSIVTRTDCRIDALFAGCLYALWYKDLKRWLSAPIYSYLWIPLAALTIAEVAFEPLFEKTTIEMLFPALLIVTVLHPQRGIGRLLETKPFRMVGVLSYSLYLWQQLVMQPPAGAGSAEVVSGFSRLQYFPANLAFVVVAALLSYYLLERPMQQLGHSLANKKLDWNVRVFGLYLSPKRA